MPADNQKNFNVNLDADLADSFAEQTDSRGYTKYKALEGAVKAYMALAPELQVRLISCKTGEAYQILIDGLLDAEILKHLEKLGPTREKFLALLKQAKAQSSRKK